MKPLSLVLLIVLLPFAVYGQGVEASKIRKTTFANLGTPTEGQVREIPNGTPGSPCTVGSAKVWAYANGTSWICTTHAPVSGGSGGVGDVVGPSASADGEVSLFSLTTGKVLKRSNGLNFSLVKLTAGVPSAAGASDLPSGIDATKIGGGGVSSTEYDFLGSVTSNVQDQLNLKAPLISPSFTTPSLGVATATSINGNTFTTGTYTVTGGAGKTFTFNNTLSLTGTDGTTMTFPATSDSIPGLAQNNTFTATGALSSGLGPALKLNGTWITGGSATTTKPYVLIEPSGTTSAFWSTNGTGLGINASSGYTGDLFNAGLNGVSKFSVSAAGAIGGITDMVVNTTNFQIAKLSQTNGNTTIVGGTNASPGAYVRAYGSTHATLPSVVEFGALSSQNTSPTANTGGGYTRTISEATVTLSGASGSIAVNIPVGARLLGVQLRVDTLITSGDGGTTWTAAYAGGATQAITSGQAFTKNTKANIMFDNFAATPIVAGSVATITITPNSGTFSGGAVRAVAYYENFVALSNQP